VKIENIASRLAFLKAGFREIVESVCQEFPAYHLILEKSLVLLEVIMTASLTINGRVIARLPVYIMLKCQQIMVKTLRKQLKSSKVQKKQGQMPSNSRPIPRNINH